MIEELKEEIRKIGIESYAQGGKDAIISAIEMFNEIDKAKSVFTTAEVVEVLSSIDNDLINRLI